MKTRTCMHTQKKSHICSQYIDIRVNVLYTNQMKKKIHGAKTKFKRATRIESRTHAISCVAQEPIVMLIFYTDLRAR